MDSPTKLVPIHGGSLVRRVYACPPNYGTYDACYTGATC